MSRGTLDCPVCGDGGGFHEDDCGAGIVVPGAWKPVEPEKVRLTDEEIAERRREAARRRAEKAELIEAVNRRTLNGESVTIRSDGVRSWIEEAADWAGEPGTVPRETAEPDAEIVAESDGS